MTSYNATAEQVNQGVTNTPIGSVTFNGTAANAQSAANVLQTATQNAPGGVGTQYQATHVDDPIGAVIGGNPPTGGVPGQSLGDAHGTYTGSLPPEKLPDGRYNPMRGMTDQVWGNGQFSQPIEVPSIRIIGEEK